MIKRTFAATLLTQLLASGAWAQSGIEEVVVTAQKRSERLQDVPITVNVVDSARIASSGIKNLTELGAIIPGLNMSSFVGSVQPSIRGVSALSNVVENPVALYIDGVYIANSREGLRELVDIDQVTVLKGPQGTLFGRNATAGLIQISTRAPSFTTHAEATVGYDNYDTFRTSAYLTGGLTDKVAASLSGSYATQGDGWGKSLTTGLDTYKQNLDVQLRGKVLFQPSDRTRITAIADYLQREDSGTNYQPYPGTTFSYPGFGPVSSRYDTYAGTPGWNRFHGWGASLEIDHDFNFAKLVSITSYRNSVQGFRFDFTNVASPNIISTARLPQEYYTQEIQLISPSGGRFQWVAGLYYFHNKIGYDPFPRRLSGPFTPLPTSTAFIDASVYETTESIAPFAQADIEVVPDTTLTLGARMTYESRKMEGTNTIRNLAGATTIIPINKPDLTITRPTFRVALAHKFSEDILAYASYNTGIKSGGYNLASPTGPGYNPETLEAWEIGLKTQLFDDKLTFNTSAFYYQYKNLQVIAFLGLTPSLINGARSELYGLDMDFQARLTDEFSLSGGLEVMHSEFISFPNALISTPRPTGGALLVSGNAAGNRLPLAQEFVGTLALDYKKAIGPINTHLNVTSTYNSDYFFEPDNFVRQKPYVMLNSSLRISDSSDRASLTFGVSNILDETVIARHNTQAYAYFVNYGFAPRVYSVTAAFKY